MDRDNIVTILSSGTRSFQNAMQEKVAFDIESLFVQEVIERNTKGLILTLFKLKQVYGKQFDEYIDSWLENSSHAIEYLKEAKFAEASSAYIPKLLVSETIEQMHKDYTFEEIYEKDMYYPELLISLEEQQFKQVPKGYFFKFSETSIIEQSGNSVFIFVDEDDVTFGDVCEIASLRLYEGYFDCELVPLGYLPGEDEGFVYVRISDAPRFEIS